MFVKPSGPICRSRPPLPLKLSNRNQDAMAVYVDNMRARVGRLIMCHMIADTEDELHVMADQIGVARRWYQGDHYDIALSKRYLALEAGAVEITFRQAGCMMSNKRFTGHLGDPATAVELARERIRRSRGSIIQGGVAPAASAAA